MKATDYKIQLVVTVETTCIDGHTTLDEILDKIRARIKEQLAGHRTPERLANTASTGYSWVVSETSREV